MSEEALVIAAFRKADTNGDHVISRKEFETLFQLLDSSAWSEEKLDKLFSAADVDRNGNVDINEFIAWVFSDAAAQVKATVTVEASEPVKKEKSKAALGSPNKAKANEADDSSSSSSSSSSESEGESRPQSRQGVTDMELPVVTNRELPGGNDRELPKSVTSPLPEVGKKSRKVKKLRKRRKRLGESPIGMSEMYEYMTLDEGAVGARMTLMEFADIFHKCKDTGLGPKLSLLVPQDCEQYDGIPEDVSALEVGHLYAMACEKPEADESDARRTIKDVKDVCRGRPATDISEIGLNPESQVDFKLFQTLLRFLTATMIIDEIQLLAHLAWVRTSRFELSEAQAVLVMEKLFLKTDAGKHGDILTQPIKSNDFMRMCHVYHLSDNKGEKGIPHAQLNLLYSTILRKMPELLEARDEQRNAIHGTKAVKRKKHHHHGCIWGRTKLAVLFNELWKAMPGGLYHSPLSLVLHLLGTEPDNDKK